MNQKESSCCDPGPLPVADCGCAPQAELKPLATFEKQDTVCCGAPPAPPSSSLEKPGYRLWHFVEELLDTPAGPVPRIKTKFEKPDRRGAVLARMTSVRDDYKVAPGLYAVGRPGPDSVVLVTANYKLSFDYLRRELNEMDAWLLVLDTRGVNVWCAAGKKTFSTDEVIRRVKMSGLEKVVNHRELILPQLSATGVSAHQVKKGSGFKVIWGPVQARDIKDFLEAGKKAASHMRRVTFDFWERMVLAPMEISQMIKPAMLIILFLFVMSGVGRDIFSFGAAWSRGLIAVSALVLGIMSGAILGPALLPWLPGRAFSIKGALTGLLGGAATIALWWGSLGWGEGLALVLLAAAISSYLTMNFTGATPFTSPSGVEKEMRRAIPLQAGALLAVFTIWLGAAFVA